MWSLTTSSSLTRAAFARLTIVRSPVSWVATWLGLSGPTFPRATGVGSVYTSPDQEVWIWSGATWVLYEASKGCTMGRAYEQN